MQRPPSLPPVAQRNPLLAFDLPTRRVATATGTSLGALADALARELEPLRQADLEALIPRDKARLTRIGGRCPVHGTYLEFDPWQAHRHRCRLCDAAYVAPEHDQWWAMGAQLWVAERAVHAAALYALRGDARHRTTAETILDLLSTRYLRYPNQDNVLGPTRPFFSTYLESLWLLNVCHAVALLEQVGATPIGARVRDQLIEPSATLIAGFHEGRSNRQVWNGAAVLSAALLLGDAQGTAAQLHGANALSTLMRTGLGANGGWYEGENYHLFAHRGFWYVVQTMAAQGVALDGDAAARYANGFAFPFSGLLPDECFPSRKDSQYRVSIRQWRVAEYLELGYAHTGQDQLAGLLTRVYDGSVSRQSDARARTTGDAERNEPAMQLTRASLSWRALLLASPEPPPIRPWTPSSASREHEGLSVMRRAQARVYVGLEGGGDTRGHGHPDALALTLQAEHARILEDPGTGSYVDRSLFWYRSTLAHHAPLVNGASQHAEPATVLNFEERGGAGWMRKRVQLEPGVTCTRSCIVLDGYLVDVLEWSAPHTVSVTLPVAAGVARDAICGAGTWAPAERLGAGGEEDGFGFLRDVHEAALAGHAAWALARSGRHAHAWYAATGTPRLVHATAPGAPGCPETTRVLIEAHGASGRIVGVWSWAEPTESAAVNAVLLQPAEPIVATVTTHCGTRAEHGAADHGWHIALHAGGSRSSIDLEGPLTPSPAAPTPERALLAPQIVTSPWRVRLGEQAYVATEEPYGGDNAPRADVVLQWTSDALLMDIRVTTGHALVSTGGTSDEPPANALDNEPVDVNADSLQWYLGDPGEPHWAASGLLALLPNGTVRATPLATPLASRWPVTPVVEAQASNDGWQMRLRIPRASIPVEAVRVNLTINERPAWRERRRGQLRLAGGGFRRYIAGAREDATACPIVLR